MNPDQLIIKMALDAWQQQVSATNKTLDQLSDEDLLREIVPGRNRGIYLLGHLVAVHDMLLPLLRLEAAAFPALKPVFLDSPDNKSAGIPPAAELRAQWKAVNEKLAQHFENLTAAEWLTRHASVTEEDFANAPHRNRLNVLLSRTSHLSYHRGQLVLLTAR